MIAVLDTGLKPAFKSLFTQAADKSCKPDGEAGWNFIDDTNQTEDDNGVLHGSVVSTIVWNQAAKIQKRPVSILPVKIHNSEGRGDLFNILCSFAYAANCGAKIINASFGFYARVKAKAPSILEEFVKKCLEKNHVLLVAAAGNQDDTEDALYADANSGNPRSLDDHSFFPACLSDTCKNVLTVTTVTTAKHPAAVSPDQNFSPRFAGIGVQCDGMEPGHFYFQHPWNYGIAIYGSSYAAPAVTGLLSQYYDDLGPAGSFDAKQIILKLESLGTVLRDPQLEPFVHNGSFYKP